MLTLGSHLLRTYSRIQATVAHSSAESELNAAVKVSTEALGLVAQAKEMRLSLSANVLMDSSAALGLIKRQGSGRLKHVRTQQLWIQEVSSEGRLSYFKIPREENLADILTPLDSRGG